MALTRNFLKTIGLTDDQIQAVIDGHTDTVAALTTERDELKKTAEAVDTLTKERDQYKAAAEKAGDTAKVQAEYDAYKQQVEGEKTRATKRTALDALLKDKVGIARDEVRTLILDAANLDDYQLGEDGGIVDAENHAKTLATKHAAFVGKESRKGTPPVTPPASNGAKMTRDEIMKTSDRAERVRQIAANLDQFE